MNDKTQEVKLKKEKTLKGIKVDGEDKQYEVTIEASAANGNYKKDGEEKSITAKEVKKDNKDESNKSVKVKYNGGHLKKSLKLTEVDNKKVKGSQTVWSKMTVWSWIYIVVAILAVIGIFAWIFIAKKKKSEDEEQF